MIFGSVRRVKMCSAKSADAFHKGGITYVAQVLKRNRTLKVLNLSENKLDVQGLTAVAEALVTTSPLHRYVKTQLLHVSSFRSTTPHWKHLISVRTLAVGRGWKGLVESLQAFIRYPDDRTSDTSTANRVYTK
jgi:hypothetical protein